ncbi:MAG: DUF1918 domain-containing protein [Acidimicrobiales bacterium]|jgi:hypothetical protein|nr:DUF1918 domain-containing protein [Acidimicrobiales bacterium]
MQVRVGDRIRQDTEWAGERARAGEVIDVFSGAAGKHYRVQWDTGAETILFPDETWTVEPVGQVPEIDLRDETRGRASLEVWIDDTGRWAEALVSVRMRSLEITGSGHAEHHRDPPEPREVVSELAVARALSDAAGQLRALAALQMRSRRPTQPDLRR